MLVKVCPSPQRRRELLPLCVAFVLTKLLTLYSISLIPASLTYTIKGTSPIFTVILAYFVMGKVFSLLTYVSLIPITVGVAMAAVSKLEFSAQGLLYAVTSVGMGVSYQMYMKSVMDSSSAAAIAAAEATRAHARDPPNDDPSDAAAASTAAAATAVGVPSARPCLARCAAASAAVAERLDDSSTRNWMSTPAAYPHLIRTFSMHKQATHQPQTVTARHHGTR